MHDTPTDPALDTQSRRHGIAFIFVEEGFAIAGQLTVQMIEWPRLRPRRKQQ